MVFLVIYHQNGKTDTTKKVKPHAKAYPALVRPPSKKRKPKSTAYKLTDGGGLYLLVTPSGGKLWRLDYLLELLGENEKADMVAGYLKTRHPMPTPLMPGASVKGGKKNNRWQVFVNTYVEPDL